MLLTYQFSFILSLLKIHDIISHSDEHFKEQLFCHYFFVCLFISALVILCIWVSFHLIFLCQFSYLIVHDLKGIAYMTSIVTSPLLLDAIGRSLFCSYNITWIFYFLSKPFKRINILNIFSTLSDFVFWRLSFNWYCMLPLSKLSEYIYGLRLHISTCLST